jgi:hypothetical protein
MASHAPFEVDLGGAVFADGAGYEPSFWRRCPSPRGYTTVFRNFDLNTQKPTVKELKVVGVEKVTVPAGTFDAYKVEVADADRRRTDDLLDCARDGRRTIKSSAGHAASSMARLWTIERVE